MNVNDPSIVIGNTFISDGTGHAVDLGTFAATASISWDNKLVSSATEWDGVTGSPITTTTTGNEAILCNVASGQILTINVTDFGSLPTVKNDGAGTVNIVSGQKNFKFTVNPSIIGYEWRLYVDSGIDGELGTTLLAGEETATVDNQTYTYTYSVDTDVILQIISDNYEEFNGYYTLVNGDQDLTTNLTLEENT